MVTTRKLTANLRPLLGHLSFTYTACEGTLPLKEANRDTRLSLYNQKALTELHAPLMTSEVLTELGAPF